MSKIAQISPSELYDRSRAKPKIIKMVRMLIREACFEVAQNHSQTRAERTHIHGAYYNEFDCNKPFFGWRTFLNMKLREHHRHLGRANGQELLGELGDQILQSNESRHVDRQLKVDEEVISNIVFHTSPILNILTERCHNKSLQRGCPFVVPTHIHIANLLTDGLNRLSQGVDRYHKLNQTMSVS